MKTCFKCGQGKPLSDFYAHPQMGDGYLNKCKTCTKRDTKNNRDAKIDQYRAYDRERYHQPQRQALLEEQKRKYPERIKARMTVRVAVYQGRLIRGSCEVCGAPKADAHHEDYTRPMDVRWLCKQHHANIHFPPESMSVAV